MTLEKQLQQQEITPELATFRDYVFQLGKMSRTKMSENFEAWDTQNEVFRGIRSPDEADKKADKKAAPVKMVVPHTYAQVMTFVSFLFLLYNQNRTFFELLPSGNEDFGDKQHDLEALVQRDVRRNSFNRVLFQLLLDVGRFGIGICECSWTQEAARVRVPTTVTIPVGPNGETAEIPFGEDWQDFIRYAGNALRNVSPYKFLPDTRFPIADFQRGEFCGMEEEYSISELKAMEAVGEVFGVDYIEPLAGNWESFRGGVTRSSLTEQQDLRQTAMTGNVQSIVLVTKMQIRIVPNRFMFAEEKPLGKEDFPVLYHVWVANDQRVIRCEPANWWHGQFGFTLGHFLPDMHETLITGLADLIYRLQEVVSWFINSHITSVRKVLQNRFVINPNVIDMKSFDGEGHIYLRSGVNPMLAERAVTQLQVHDVTAGHMQDTGVLGALMQTVTGVNENAMGQYNGGRRSATEARAVAAGAAGRMKMHGQLIWEQCLEPLARMMVANLRQALPVEQFTLALGPEAESRYNVFKGTPEEVICGHDYFTFDSTLQSEKGFMAQSLQELLLAIMNNPAAAQQTGINPQKLLEEIQWLRGAGNVKRFKMTEEELYAQQMATQGASGGVGGVPPNGSAQELPVHTQA